MVPLTVQFIGPCGEAPAYQTENSVGFDVCAQPANSAATRAQLAWQEGPEGATPRWVLHRGALAKIPLGIRIDSAKNDLLLSLACRETPYEGVILPVLPHLELRPRSSLSARGIDMRIGTIDPDYRDEICAVLKNNSNEQIVIELGDRIGQLVGTLAFRAGGVNVKTRAREGGFGSTNQ